MKKHLFSLLALSLASTLSSPTYAVEGGTALTWSEHPYLIESDCTGTVLGGKYVLIAGHCAASVSSPFPRQVNLSNGESMMPTARNADPYYNVDGTWGGGVDVAIWTLPSTTPMDNVAYLADLNDPATTVNVSDEVSFMGFGQDDNTPRLGQAFNEIIIQYPAVFIYADPIAHSVPGDSGAPIFNADNKIVGTNYAGSGSDQTASGMYEQSGVNLHFVKDWLLENIDRWHSATELTFTGEQTIEVQSLHVNGTDMATRQNNGTLTTGDVTVTGGTCVTDGAVAPFGMCTLELKSGTGEGKIILEEGNDITVNRAPTPEPSPEPQPDNGGSGGSFGWGGLLGLFMMALRRKV